MVVTWPSTTRQGKRDCLGDVMSAVAQEVK